MTAKEIREKSIEEQTFVRMGKIDEPATFVTLSTPSTYFLREIAAQLAEMNSHLASLSASKSDYDPRFGD